MQNSNPDLGIYSAIFSAYRHRIKQAQAIEEATLHAAAFLDQVEGMFDGDITISFYEEVEYLWTIFPSHKRTLEKYKELLEVLLGQAVDFYWYAQYPKYHSYRDVKNDPNLCSFRRFAQDFDVKFTYVQYYRHVLMRVPNSLRLRYRRLVNHPGKYTQGLMTTRCKPAMVGLVNRISEDVAGAIRPRKPFKILVNSILRTVEYQHSLARIGYVAPRNSGHLAGYAVDVEKKWYQENDQRAHAAIEEILGGLYASGEVNLIREGTHWHICLNPDHIQHYETLSQKWARDDR